MAHKLYAIHTSASQFLLRQNNNFSCTKLAQFMKITYQRNHQILPSVSSLNTYILAIIKLKAVKKEIVVAKLIKGKGRRRKCVPVRVDWSHGDRLVVMWLSSIHHWFFVIPAIFSFTILLLILNILRINKNIKKKATKKKHEFPI